MTLECSLASFLGDIEVLDRRKNVYASTFPSEILTCRFPDGRIERFLVKSSSGRDHSAFGHRGGVRYEAMVYRQVVEPSGLTAPRYYGEISNGESAVVLQYLDGAVNAEEYIPVQDALEQAAAWAGR